MKRPIQSALIGIAACLAARPLVSHAVDPATDIAWCVAQAAEDFPDVPRLAILMILDTEGGWPGAEIRNTNGSYDLGPMQINTQWLPTFASFGLTREMLRDHACTNIYAGTWILREELRRHPDLPEALAYYHSPTEVHQERYLSSMRKRLQRRLQEFGLSGTPMD